MDGNTGDVIACGPSNPPKVKSSLDTPSLKSDPQYDWDDDEPEEPIRMKRTRGTAEEERLKEIMATKDSEPPDDPERPWKPWAYKNWKGKL